MARGDDREGSDVDILVTFEGKTTYDTFFDLKFYLEDTLGRPVDLVTQNALRPELRPRIEREAIPVPRLESMPISPGLPSRPRFPSSRRRSGPSRTRIRHEREDQGLAFRGQPPLDLVRDGVAVDRGARAPVEVEGLVDPEIKDNCKTVPGTFSAFAPYPRSTSRSGRCDRGPSVARTGCFSEAIGGLRQRRS